ncbi:MAG TPA: hydantoinase/oxoprolinase family protein [Acetobacteraceae bacterium]|nr:hydantoinase/oxoprolinase family protein [Acetobacteraceae bacterium]
MGIRIGVDIGGTFTDFVAFDETTGLLASLKVFSRPDHPGQEVIEGMRLLADAHGIRPQDVSYFTHGTTVGVNTVIQRKGPRLALFTTRHFEDVLEMARLKIADMYNLLSRRPPVLIPREHVFGVTERIGADGQVETELDEAAAEQAVRHALAAGCEGAVIAFLHAYRNPAHEQHMRCVVERMAPGLRVFCSAEVWPIIREYERTITAVVSAYVQPRISRYLDSLQTALRSIGVQPDLLVTKSNGGVMSAAQAKSDCIQMVFSGTASGVIGASYVAQLAGLKDCLSLDIGGTSADLALIADGAPQFGTGEFIGDFQVFIPSVSVTSIGDGGGSIASVDEHGVLKVGPESAGSSPGPACYGRGGERPTVTDAFAVNGWIGHAALGYDAVRVDRDAARRAVDTLARRLGQDVHRTAAAIIDVAVSGMYTGVSGVVSRHGIDLRSFSLLPFGGAGPMMACFIANELGMRHIVVPTTPGVLSALGGLIADLKNDFVHTVYVDLLPGAMPKLAASLRALRVRGERWLRSEQSYDGPVAIQVSAELRYKGQSFEIETALEASWFEHQQVQQIANAFHARHQQVYGYADPSAAVQVVALRVVAAGVIPKPQLARIDRADRPPERSGEARVWLDGDWRDVPLFDRATLRAGPGFAGPAIVTQSDSTTCILPGFTTRIDDYGNIHIHTRAEGPTT